MDGGENPDEVSVDQRLTIMKRPSRSKTSRWHGGWVMLGAQNGTTVTPDCAPSYLMPDLAHRDWLCQGQRGRG